MNAAELESIRNLVEEKYGADILDTATEIFQSSPDRATAVAAIDAISASIKIKIGEMYGEQAQEPPRPRGLRVATASLLDALEALMPGAHARDIIDELREEAGL